MKKHLLSPFALTTCAFALSACSTPSSTTPPPSPSAPIVDCRELAPGQLRLWAEAGSLHVAPGKARSTVVHVDPDLCVGRVVAVTVDDPRVARASLDGATFDLEHPTRTLRIEGVGAGSATVTLELTDVDGKVLREGVSVVVGDDRAVACAGEATGALAAGGRVVGVGALAGASAAVPAYASLPVTQGYRWPFTPTDLTIGCGQPALPENTLVSLSAPVRFKQKAGDPWRMRREIDFRIPVNLARMPEKASLRHVELWFSNEKFTKPRPVPVADLRIEHEGARAFLAFKAPAYGTWEARVKVDAGTKKYMRRLTHRAAIGVSMGGAGTAIVGMNHHDRWDALAPLGGPVDLTWLLQHIGVNHVAGFPTNDGVTAPTTFEDPRELERREIPSFPYEHRSTFNEWWYEYPKDGNGGTFDRGAYSQIFRDLALAFGSWNGPGNVEGGETLPLGVPANDKSFLGTRSDRGCAIYADPVSGDPFEERARELERTCPTQRCANGFRALHYYDDEFNPKGRWPVISVCDGGSQRPNNSPWANQFVGAKDQPIEVALAVDYNDNGVRDANEPVIRSPHEPFRDFGADGKPSAEEPGYKVGVNEDPAGDDYDAQFNPSGTEGNGRRDEGEAFDDFGLDGVRNTPEDGRQWDFGEGNGVYDEALGLKTMGKTDPRAIAMGWATPKGGAFKGEAVRRVDLWLDGGTRDLFNFSSSAQSLAGALFAAGKSTTYLTSTRSMPNAARFAPTNDFDPGRTAWGDLPNVVFYRYGQTEPGADGTISPESGKHVGTAVEIEARLRSALYFIGSRWPDAPRYLTPRASDAPAPGALDCEVTGNCSFEFKSSDGRRGPVTVSLPPGYAHEAMQGVRFPVIYMLHGYGMEPSSLSAAIVFVERWMNSPQYSASTRMPKAILVYVDGRCRFSTTGEPECYRGNFYADSPRKGGVQASKWWLELMGEVDRRYRTMPESTVEFTE